MVLRASPPPQVARPVPRGRPVEGHAPSPLGVSRVALDLRVQACCRHYPGGPLGRIARGTVYSNRALARQRLRPSPSQCKVGAHIGRFEACSTFTRVTACLLAASPEATHLSRRLRRLRYLRRRSDSYRPERPSCRVGIAPTEVQHLSTAHTRSDPDLPFIPPGSKTIMAGFSFPLDRLECQRGRSTRLTCQPPGSFHS